jgi:hypothetical protein
VVLGFWDISVGSRLVLAILDIMISSVAVHVQVFRHGLALPGRCYEGPPNILQGAFLLGRSLVSSEV